MHEPKEEIKMRMEREQMAIEREVSFTMQPHEYKGNIVCYRTDYWRRSESKQQPRCNLSCLLLA